MKRPLFFAFCLIVLLCAAGCSVDNDSTALLSGGYFAQGDYEEMLTPYLWLDTEKHTFHMGAGMIVSYAEHGAYEIKDGKLIATSQITTVVFEIQDEKTLILIDNGDSGFLKIPLGTEFVYSKK